MRQVEHEITVEAPADTVYRLIADVTNWPRIFPPSVHVERVPDGDTEEVIRIWATANGTAKTWTSRRRLDPRARIVTFRQEVCTPPVAAMSGAWVIESLSGKDSRVVLRHDYRAIDDDPDKLAWIDAAVDRNSGAELAALKANAEPSAGPGPLMSFSDTVWIGRSAADVYDFINDADRWEQRLPHVTRVSLTEDSPGTQVLEMDTLTKDGQVHTTKSVRVCFPHRKIVYKQTVLPPLLSLHTGYWLIEERDGGVDVTAEHTVVINTAVLGTPAIEAVLGAGADVDDAKQFVRKALSTNSRTTLQHAGRYGERPS